MHVEIVTVLAGGREWTAFERVMVRAGLDEAARSFELKLAAEPVPAIAAATFGSGAEISILFNGELVCRGYVDRYQPRLSEHNNAEINVSGRSKAQDVIDSSAVHDTGRFENKTLLQIAQELDKFGVGFSTDQQLESIEKYQITPGEKAFRCLEKLARHEGVTLCGQPDGSVKITRASKQRHAGGLIEGVNIKTGEADHNWSGRHSDVIVRGQRPFGHGPDALEIEAKARDNSVGRYRPVIVIQDADIDKKKADKRARNRRDKEAGEALSANITSQGFRDLGGKIWTPGFLVPVISPFLAIGQDMVVKTVTFSQDRRSGSESVITVTDPRAHGGQGSKGGSAGAGWNMDIG